MKMNVMVRSHGGAIQSRRLVVPAPQRGFNFFVDPMPDGLHDLGFDDIAFGVDRNLDHHIAD